MARLKCKTRKNNFLLAVAAIVVYTTTAFAQSTKDACGPTPVIPLTGEEPPAKIVVYPPLAEPLASRGVAIIQYCAQNLHLVPVFGPNKRNLGRRDPPRICATTGRYCRHGALVFERLANTDLGLQLKKHGIEKLIVMGLIAHTCVEATVRYAAELAMRSQW